MRCQSATGKPKYMSASAAEIRWCRHDVIGKYNCPNPESVRQECGGRRGKDTSQFHDME